MVDLSIIWKAILLIAFCLTRQTNTKLCQNEIEASFLSTSNSWFLLKISKLKWLSLANFVIPSNPHLETETLPNLIATWRQMVEWHFLELKYFVVLGHKPSVSPFNNKHKANFLFSLECDIFVTLLAVPFQLQDSALFRWVILRGSEIRC